MRKLCLFWLPLHCFSIVFSIHIAAMLRFYEIVKSYLIVLVVLLNYPTAFYHYHDSVLAFGYVKLTYLLFFNIVQLQMKKTFFVPDNLSVCYPFFKQKFSSDFSSTSVSTIKLMIIQLRKWIKYIEDKSNYPARFVHHFRCPTIHQFDWSVIRIPSDYYIDVMILN